MNNKQNNFYPEDWNDNTNNLNQSNNQTQTSNTYTNSQNQSGINPAILLSLFQKGTLDTSELLKNFLPQNSAIASLLPMMQATKKTVKTVSSQSKIQNKIDISKFKNVKDYYK